MFLYLKISTNVFIVHFFKESFTFVVGQSPLNTNVYVNFLSDLVEICLNFYEEGSVEKLLMKHIIITHNMV